MTRPGLRGLYRSSNRFVYVSSTCLAILLCQFDRKRERDKINIDWPINRRPLSDNRASTAFRDQSLSLCDIVILVPVRQSSTPVTPLDLDLPLFSIDVHVRSSLRTIPFTDCFLFLFRHLFFSLFLSFLLITTRRLPESYQKWVGK